jgi:hypothetical protein
MMILLIRWEEIDIMTTWTVSQARRDFEIGYLTDFQIIRSPMNGGWNVMLRGGTNHGFLVDARARNARLFKTVDAAISEIERIGFVVEGLARG